MQMGDALQEIARQRGRSSGRNVAKWRERLWNVNTLTFACAHQYPGHTCADTHCSVPAACLRVCCSGCHP